MKNKPEILLVEDEETMAIGLEFNLSEEGYKVTWARDGRQALKALSGRKFDLLILDVMLPYHDGFEIARRVRSDSPQVPILFLTARRGVEDRIRGLEIGGDDYLTKPFHLKELLLRVQGMLRRKEWYKTTAGMPVYRLGEKEIHWETLTVKAGEKTFRLTPQEAHVLKYLIDHPGRVVSRQELLEKVWQADPDLETRTIDNFVSRLRKYFEPDPSHPVYILSVRGAGYIFKEPAG